MIPDLDLFALSSISEHFKEGRIIFLQNMVSSCITHRDEDLDYLIYVFKMYATDCHGNE